MKKIAASDIETNKWIHFLMIGIYFDGVYSVFSNLDDYLDFVLKKKFDGVRIYFHNGGRFDFLFLIDRLMERGVVKFLNRGTSLLGLVFSNGKTRVEFYDSYALLPASLDKLIKTYGIEEKKIPIDFNKNRKFSDKKLHEHLKNDCISLYKILDIFQNEEGYLSSTIASHALRKFRELFFKGDFWNVSDAFDNYFRKNYYKGGRVEVYKGYGKNLYYYDINSLYPAVMLEKMPIGVPEKTKSYKKGKIGFYKIQLLGNYDEKISLLALKSNAGNFYVSGKKGDIFYLISCEIEELIKKVKVKILDGYYFRDSDYLFNEYVNYYYKQKKNAKNETDRYISKLMLNSLYGKFGQKLNGQNIEMDTGQGDYPVFDAEAGLLLVDRERRIKFKGVYIAAYITALARIKHYKLMEKIGFENIYYCDTDSIITSKKIKTTEKIGDVKLEAKIKEGVFLMPKVYGYIDNNKNEYVKFKGFQSKVFSFNDLKRLASGKIEKLEQVTERILGFRESIKRKNNIKDSAGTFLKMVNQKKVLVFNYSRRKIVKDKKHLFITNCLSYDEAKNIKKIVAIGE